MCKHLHKFIDKPMGVNFATVTCMDCGKLIDDKAPADFYCFDNPWDRTRVRKPSSGRPTDILPFAFHG